MCARTKRKKCRTPNEAVVRQQGDSALRREVEV
jgi:hypothetical protein